MKNDENLGYRVLVTMYLNKICSVVLKINFDNALLLVKEGVEMKIAITGKGGVGKTLTSAMLISIFQKEGHSVLAVDADPDSSLASSLGFHNPNDILPIVNMKELIGERTGTKPGDVGAFFKLNPYVSDIPDEFSVQHNGIKLIAMGGFKEEAGGCFCSENAFLKTLLRHLLTKRDEVVVLDMEPGIEHLSRGTADAVNVLLIVVDAGKSSLETARKIQKFATDIGLKCIKVIGNRVRNEEDKNLITEAVSPIEVLGFIPDSEEVRAADIKGESVMGVDKKVEEEFLKIKESILRQIDRCN